MRPVLVPLLFVAGAAGAFAIRTAHPPLARDFAEAATRALGRPVTIARAALRADGTLRLEALDAGLVRAQRIDVTVDARAALTGRARPRRLVAHGVRVEHAGLPIEAAELAVELDGGRPTRVAFTGARLGAAGRVVVDGLAGSASRDGERWRVRAARRGLSLTGQIHPETAVLEARAELERLPLAGAQALFGRGLDLSRGLASGAVHLRASASALRARGRVDVADVTADHPALARRRVGPFSLTLDGEVASGEGGVAVERLQVQLGAVTLTLRGGLARAGTFEGEVALLPIGCGDLLRALPDQLAPALDGLAVTGRILGWLRLRGARDRLEDLRLDVELGVGCKVRSDPPLADARALMRPVERPHAQDEHGAPRRFVLGPENPSFRTLESLPPHVPRVFVIAEDSRFFRHGGFDLDNVRRALVADLVFHRFDRGASTISQQVVKNLFLSNERTAARKLEEAVLTWRLEQVVPKRRILELYLNLVELGPGIYGVAEASERYFGKEVDELSVDEAAQLAALLPAPRRGMDAGWQKRYEALTSRLPASDELGLELTRR